MGKAAYGALMGLGQGITQWGGALMADTLSKEKEKREFDRQASLLDIQQRYQQTQLEETRLYNEGQKAEERTYQEKIKDEDRDYALRAATPGTKEYEARQRLESEQLENQKALRAVPYGGSGGSGSTGFGTYNPANYSDETNQAIMEAYSANLEAGMGEQEALIDAQRQVGVAGDLKSKPSAAGQDLGMHIDKSLVDFIEDVSKLPKDEIAYDLAGDDDDLYAEYMKKSKDDLVDLLVQKQKQAFQRAGLMNNPPAGNSLPPPGANNDPLGIRN